MAAIHAKTDEYGPTTSGACQARVMPAFGREIRLSRKLKCFIIYAVGVTSLLSTLGFTGLSKPSQWECGSVGN
jgi:hypothetical protein